MNQSDEQWNSRKKRRKKRRHRLNENGRLIRALCICLVILSAFTWIVSGIGSGEDGEDRKPGRGNNNSYAPDDVPDWIVQDFLLVNEYSRPGTPLKQVNGIVVHYVANPGTTGWENRSYFEGLAESHETKAGAHFIIGLDGTIIQCVPLNELTYCSNDRNVDTVSIECCHPEADGKFTEETYNSLVKLCKWLMERYDLDTDDVIRHYDVTGKLCPLYFVEHEDAWEAFKEELK